MNSTNEKNGYVLKGIVWEICKFWILQTTETLKSTVGAFERYVNFEFYKLKNIRRWRETRLRDM